jgi:hypothetical protein
VCAALAALGAASAAMGCVEEPLGPPPVVPAPYRDLGDAELATLGTPGPQDRPFGEALSGYAQAVSRIQAFTGARSDSSIAWAVLQLAAALERMPAAAAQPRLRGAAEAMRKNEAGNGEESVEPPVERVKQSLAIAATALLQLARSHYSDTPQIAAEARVFAATIQGIDPEREPPDRASIIDALTRATGVLARMYAANAAPASSVRP